MGKRSNFDEFRGFLSDAVRCGTAVDSFARRPYVAEQCCGDGALVAI
jgi:hypothetical protein